MVRKNTNSSKRKDVSTHPKDQEILSPRISAARLRLLKKNVEVNTRLNDCNLWMVIEHIMIDLTLTKSIARDCFFKMFKAGPRRLFM